MPSIPPVPTNIDYINKELDKLQEILNYVTEIYNGDTDSYARYRSYALITNLREQLLYIRYRIENP